MNKIENFENYIKNIEKPMMKNKHIKKKIFLYAIKNLDNFFRLYGFDNPEIRAKLVYYSQIYFKKLDDIVDGDEVIVDKNISFNDAKKYTLEFVNDRREYLLSSCKQTTKFDLDILLYKILELSAEYGMSFEEEFEKLFDSLEFDAKRRCDIVSGEIIKSSEFDIGKYFFEDYADSCGKCILKIVNANIDDLSQMHNITFANRIYFNEIDFFEDISSGLINISEEDFIKFNIKEEDVLKIASLSNEITNINHLCKQKGFTHPLIQQYLSKEINNWLLYQLEIGKKYMDDWEQHSKVNSMSDCLTDLFLRKENPEETLLYLSYGFGTNRYFKKLSKHL